MLNRRQILTGLGATSARCPCSNGALGRADQARRSIALLVIDVQNCFLPGGSLAVKDGEQVVPVINRIAKGFANVVMTQDWHTAGHVSFASAHSGKKPFETVDLPYGKQVLWPDHCVQGTEGASLSKDLAIPHAELVIRKGFHKDVDSYSAFTEADGKTTTGLAAYLKARKIKRSSSPASPPTSAWPGPRSMRARPASRPMWSRTPAAASTRRVRSQKPGPT